MYRTLKSKMEPYIRKHGEEILKSTDLIVGKKELEVTNQTNKYINKRRNN